MRQRSRRRVTRCPGPRAVVARSAGRPRRRRLPLRPGVGPGPRAPDSSPASNGGHTGGACADRRAVGRRRHVPARPGVAGRGLAAVERSVPRRRPRVPPRRAGHDARAAPAHPGQPRPVRPSVGEHQLPHVPRRVHAVRPRRLRPQAQRGQRVGRRRRRRREPVVELRVGGRRRCARRRDGAAPPPAAQRVVPADDVARRADVRHGRRARPHPGWEQQRLQPGQRDVVGRLVSSRALRRPHPLRPDAARAPGSAPRALQQQVRRAGSPSRRPRAGR